MESWSQAAVTDVGVLVLSGPWIYSQTGSRAGSGASAPVTQLPWRSLEKSCTWRNVRSEIPCSDSETNITVQRKSFAVMMFLFYFYIFYVEVYSWQQDQIFPVTLSRTSSVLSKLNRVSRNHRLIKIHHTIYFNKFTDFKIRIEFQCKCFLVEFVSESFCWFDIKFFIIRQKN